MDMEKIKVRQDLSRMVLNYYIRGKITEDQSARICDYIDTAIGGGEFPKPYREQGRAIINFPTTYTGPKENEDEKPRQEEPREKPPEINAPYGEPLPEGIEDFRQALQRKGLALICYQKLAGREGTFYDVLWAQSGARCRCANWSGAVREEDLPYVLPLDGVIDDYKYKAFREKLKTVYTVNVAPENALKGPQSDFFAYIQSLKDTGFENDFDYVYIFAAEKRNRFLTKNKELVDLKIPARVITRLDEREIHTIKDLQRLTVQDLRKINNVGPVMLKDTIAVLKKAGITLQEEKENYV